MKKIIATVLAAILIAVGIPSFAAESEMPVDIKAKSAVLMDASTGQVLMKYNENEKRGAFGVERGEGAAIQIGKMLQPLIFQGPAAFKDHGKLDAVGEGTGHLGPPGAVRLPGTGYRHRLLAAVVRRKPDLQI